MTTASLAPRLAWRDRVRAATVHLALSALVAALAAVAVFWLWYPPPYGQLAGGRELMIALEQEPEGGEATHEIMIGIPLDMAEFRA